MQLSVHAGSCGDDLGFHRDVTGGTALAYSWIGADRTAVVAGRSAAPFHSKTDGVENG
jgi:hypothetical protein